MRWADLSDGQVSLFALLQAVLLALIPVGVPAIVRGKVSLLDAILFVVELTFFFLLNRFAYRSIRDRRRRDLERHGGDQAALDTRNGRRWGIEFRPTRDPFFPGSRGVRVMVLIAGLPILALGLLGVLGGDASPSFLIPTALGLALVLNVAETLPERLRSIAAALRMVTLCVLLTSAVLGLWLVFGKAG